MVAVGGAVGLGALLPGTAGATQAGAGQSTEATPSVSLVETSNTIQGPLTIEADDSGYTLILVDDENNNQVSFGGGKPGVSDGNINLYGANAKSSTGIAWNLDIDESADVPYCDFVISRESVGVHDSDGDGLYGGYAYGVNPSSWSFGHPQPAKRTNAWSRLTVESGSAMQGVVNLIAAGDQTAYVLTMQGQDAFNHILVDPNGGGSPDTWSTTFRGESTSGNPVIKVEGTTPVVAPVYAVQTVGFGGATGGTATLTLPTQLGGGTTGAIAYNASPAAVQAAVLGTVGCPGNGVAVTGSPGAYVLTFGSYGPAGPFVVNSSLSGGTGATVTQTTAGVTGVYPESLRFCADGSIVFGGDQQARLEHGATGAVQTGGSFVAGEMLGVGPAIVGALPTATVDVAETGTQNATLKIRTASGGFQVVTEGAAPGETILSTIEKRSLRIGAAETIGLAVTPTGDVLTGPGAQQSPTELAPNATTGFLHIPTCDGVPTGTPATVVAGSAPLVINRAGARGSRLYAYLGGAWVALA